MIKFIKNTIKKYKAKKITERYMKVERLIEKKDYVEAGKCLVSTIDVSEKMVKEKFYNLYKIYLLFLTKNYDEVIKLSKKVTDIIKQNNVDNKDTNDYFLLFVYTMVFVSSVLIEDETNKKLTINEINSLDFEYKNIFTYEIERFPLFDDEKLLEYFRENGEPIELTKEKLLYLLTNLKS